MKETAGECNASFDELTFLDRFLRPNISMIIGTSEMVDGSARLQCSTPAILLWQSVTRLVVEVVESWLFCRLNARRTDLC